MARKLLKYLFYFIFLQELCLEGSELCLIQKSFTVTILKKMLYLILWVLIQVLA